MKTSNLLRNTVGRGVVLAILLLFCCLHTVHAQDENVWQHELTIYGWFAGIDGTLKFPVGPGPGQDISVDASDILDNLNMIFMGGWKSQHNRWSIIGDLVYMDVGNSTNKTVAPGSSGEPVNASLALDIASWVVNAGVGYDMVRSDRGVLALVGGARYLGLDVDVKTVLPRGERGKSESDGFLDGFIGISGAIKFNEKWYLPYHADIGAGDSDLTWQLYAAIGYRFSWGDVRLGYRHLSYELSSDYLMEDLAMSGPVLGVGFRF